MINMLCELDAVKGMVSNGRTEMLILTQTGIKFVHLRECIYKERNNYLGTDKSLMVLQDLEKKVLQNQY